MSPLFYWTLLALTCAYAAVRGGSDERLVASIALAASVLTAFLLSPWNERYSQMESGEMLIDMLTLAGFILVALRSERFWPLWVAGFQLTGGMAHFLKIVHLDLMPQAYAAAIKFWSYPILIVIIVGTFRTHRRHVHDRNLATP